MSLCEEFRVAAGVEIKCTQASYYLAFLSSLHIKITFKSPRDPRSPIKCPMPSLCDNFLLTFITDSRSRTQVVIIVLVDVVVVHVIRFNYVHRLCNVCVCSVE